MAKKLTLKNYRNQLMDNGMVHLVYHASSMDDIIHPFSVKDFEILSDEFKAFIEEHKAVIPEKKPIVLEIIGSQFTDEQKQIIDNTIWNHFCLNMFSAELAGKKCINRCIMFLFYTIISAVLLFVVKNESNEVLTNLAYLPFWFFGYRVLIYLIIDCFPMWKDRNWYRRLASLKIVFSGKETRTLSDLNPKEVIDELKGYEHLADSLSFNNQMTIKYLMDKGIVKLGCKLSSISDIVEVIELKNKEMLSSAMAGYIGQAEVLLNPNSTIELEIEGVEFTDDEKNAIKRAVNNYYSLRIATEERQAITNEQKILFFGIFIVISAVLLFALGQKIDVARHEFIIMLFWFFGDYLLEFMLISTRGIRKTRKILESLRKMTITYK